MKIEEQIQSFLQPCARRGSAAFATNPEGVRLRITIRQGSWLVPQLLASPYAEHFRATFWNAIIMARRVNGRGRLNLIDNNGKRIIALYLTGRNHPVRFPVAVAEPPPPYSEIPENRRYIFDGRAFARKHDIRPGDQARDDKPSYLDCIRMIRAQTPTLGTPLRAYGSFWTAEEDYSGPAPYVPVRIDTS